MSNYLCSHHCNLHDSRVTPLRIEHHPDVVLDVIVVSKDQTDSSQQADHQTEIPSSDIEPMSHDDDLSTIIAGDLDPMTDNTSAYNITNLVTSTQPLNYLNQIMSGQEIQAANLQQFVEEHFKRLEAEMNKKLKLQNESLQLQRQSGDNQQKTIQLLEDTKRELLQKQSELANLHEHMGNLVAEHQAKMEQQQREMRVELSRKQDEIMVLQYRALDWLALIQRGQRVLLTQNYELHKYPIPRLFIVLPDVVVQSRDPSSSPSTERYRLYFLCECGSHTIPNGSSTAPHIHLAKHEGYELEKPKEFFKKFGSYLLAMMHMIKIGTAVAGVVVPPLTSLKILEGLDFTREPFASLKKNLPILVDNTIDLLNKNEINENIDAGSSNRQSDFEGLEALEDADLRRLESFLRDRDEGRALGNLYRIVTSEGHVKWVCHEHYRANYRESAMEHLRAVVKTCRGRFSEDTGKIEIKISSSTEAKTFYEAMVKARRVHELELTFGWKVTMEDIRTLTDAVDKAGVIRLEVDGCQLRRSMSEMIYRGRRLDPFAQLACNGHIQALRIGGSNDFFSRINRSSLKSAPRLRSFSIELEVPIKDKAVKAFHSFIEHCHASTTIELRLKHNESIETAMAGFFGDAYDYQSERVDYPNQSIIVEVSKGEIQKISITEGSERRVLLKRDVSDTLNKLRSPMSSTVDMNNPSPEESVFSSNSQQGNGPHSGEPRPFGMMQPRTRRRPRKVSSGPLG